MNNRLAREQLPNIARVADQLDVPMTDVLYIANTEIAAPVPITLLCQSAVTADLGFLSESRIDETLEMLSAENN